MIIGGLWHGAAWTFIIWGAYHGVLLVGHRLLKPALEKITPKDPIELAWWKAICIVVTFHLVCLGWLIFASTSLSQVGGMLSAIYKRAAIPEASYLLQVLVIVLPLCLVQLAQFLSKDLNIIARTPWYVRSVFYTLCFYALVLGGNFKGTQFIYFQF
jgi:alginate O-acetyltransferase complex protein AlgI